MAQSEKLTRIKNNLDILCSMKKVARVHSKGTETAEARLVVTVTARMVTREVDKSHSCFPATLSGHTLQLVS